MRVHDRTAYWGGPELNFKPLKDGDNYLFSIYVYLEEGHASTEAKLTVKRTANGMSEYLPLATELIEPGRWHRLVGIYHHTDSGGLEELYAYVEAKAVSANFFVDDFRVEPTR